MSAPLYRLRVSGPNGQGDVTAAYDLGPMPWATAVEQFAKAVQVAHTNCALAWPLTYRLVQT